MDATQIEQALLNLLINARDALACPKIEAPHLSVSVSIVRAGASELADESARDQVRVRVRDNGVGMAAATRARIYEPFFTTKDVGQGHRARSGDDSRHRPRARRLHHLRVGEG